MSNVHTFETLFSLDKRDKEKQWDIRIETNQTYSEIITTHGYVDAPRKTESRVKVEQGKNIGKKNETTHFAQAIKDAQSKWNKKRDSEGYVTHRHSSDLHRDENTYRSTTEKSVATDMEIKFPMLAQDYFKQKNKLVFPCFMQPKLDGYRMIYENGRCTSRQGKEFDTMKNTTLFTELQSIQEDLILDGELYVHGGTFEHLGVLRKKRILESDKELLEQIEYHVYDVIDTSKPFHERNRLLCDLFQGDTFQKIKIVPTMLISSETEIKPQHTRFVNDNYEGSILRNSKGMYRCKFRSSDLLKYKDFEDSEYPIVGFTFEKDTTGDDDPLIVWTCKTEEGHEFSVRPKGTHDERKELYRECSKEGGFAKYRDRNLWVKYFELTDRNIPRFPTTKTDSVFTYIRDSIE